MRTNCHGEPKTSFYRIVSRFLRLMLVATLSTTAMGAQCLGDEDDDDEDPVVKKSLNRILRTIYNRHAEQVPYGSSWTFLFETDGWNDYDFDMYGEIRTTVEVPSQPSFEDHFNESTNRYKQLLAAIDESGLQSGPDFDQYAWSLANDWVDEVMTPADQILTLPYNATYRFLGGTALNGVCQPMQQRTVSLDLPFVISYEHWSFGVSVDDSRMDFIALVNAFASIQGCDITRECVDWDETITDQVFCNYDGASLNSGFIEAFPLLSFGPWERWTHDSVDNLYPASSWASLKPESPRDPAKLMAIDEDCDDGRAEQISPNDCKKQVCRDGQLIHENDDSETPLQASPADCRKEICNGGEITGQNDNSEEINLPQKSGDCNRNACRDGAVTGLPDDTDQPTVSQSIAACYQVTCVGGEVTEIGLDVITGSVPPGCSYP